MFSNFVRQSALSNPFDDNRVTTVDGLRGDVLEINDRAFAGLQGHAEKAATSDKGRGVLVTGSPGIGKSHLLARFGQWARSERYPFIYLLNLQAGPEDLLRSVLRATVSVLACEFCTRPSQSRIYRLVSAGVKRALSNGSNENTSPPDDRQWSRGAARRALSQLLAEHQVNPSITAALWTVFDFVQCRRLKIPTDISAAFLAISWLSGDVLEPEEARRFGIRAHSAAEDGFALSIEDMKDVLRAISVLAVSRDRSLILCFDQVDTLSEDQVQSWSATVHALLDLCPGLLVVTSGVDETFLRWTSKDLVSKASWDDRIRQFPVLLSGISAEKARQMIQRRLNEWLLPFDAVPEITEARRTDLYFPITSAAGDAILKDSDGTDRNDLRPRDVISRAGAAWERQVQMLRRDGSERWLQQWQAGALSATEVDDVRLNTPEPPELTEPPDAGTSEHDARSPSQASIEKRLQEHIDRRMAPKDLLAVDSSQLIGLIRTAVAACSNAEEPWRSNLYLSLASQSVPAIVNRTKPAFGLIVEHIDPASGKRLRIGVAICDAVSGNSATNFLKRVKADVFDAPTVDRAFLIVDERRPLDLARTGSALFEFLERQGDKFQQFNLSIETFATLDALEAVVGLAKSGDLTSRNRDGSLLAISESEVRNWYHESKKYLETPVLRDILLPVMPDSDAMAPADDSGISLDVIASASDTV
jgi:hypothetical protein